MLAHLTDRDWLWIAAECYLAGFLIGTWSLLRGGKPSNIVMYGIIVVGYVLQLTGLYVRGMAVGGCPLGNTFELYQFTAWSATTLYLVVGVAFRSSLFGFFTSCLSATLTLISLAVPEWDHTRVASIFGGNPWIEFHAALALFSYGVFGLLALTAAMLMLRNYSLKHKRLDGWFSFLPSMLALDHISLRLLITGVSLMTLSLAVGGSYWVRDLATVNLSKIIATVAVWLVSTIALGLRLRGRLVSRRFAWACVAIFALALLSLPIINANTHTPHHFVQS